MHYRFDAVSNSKLWYGRLTVAAAVAAAVQNMMMTLGPVGDQVAQAEAASVLYAWRVL